MKIGIVGLGLMGGSIAKALRANTSHTIAGMDTDPCVIRAILEDGAIDEAGGIDTCDVVYICLNPGAAVRFFDETLFKPGAVVTDICGVKRYTAEMIGGRAAGRGVRYVGSHPMAGRERGGYAYSDAALFNGASYIITEDKSTDADAKATIEELALAMGCARITVCPPELHDSVIAFTSQLAHAVSNAYVKNENAGFASGFSAGSFLDLTRVARLDPDMWAELFLLNRDNLLRELDEVMSNIGGIRNALDSENAALLKQLLKRGSDRKTSMEE